MFFFSVVKCILSIFLKYKWDLYVPMIMNELTRDSETFGDKRVMIMNAEYAFRCRKLSDTPAQDMRNAVKVPFALFMCVTGTSE